MSSWPFTNPQPSCADDEQARRMWSMCSQLANPIILHSASPQSHRTTLTPKNRRPPEESSAGSPFHFAMFVEMVVEPPERMREGEEERLQSCPAQRSLPFDNAREPLRAASLLRYRSVPPSSPAAAGMKCLLRLIFLSFQ